MWGREAARSCRMFIFALQSECLLACWNAAAGSTAPINGLIPNLTGTSTYPQLCNYDPESRTLYLRELILARLHCQCINSIIFDADGFASSVKCFSYFIETMFFLKRMVDMGRHVRVQSDTDPDSNRPCSFRFSIGPSRTVTCHEILTWCVTPIAFPSML